MVIKKKRKIEKTAALKSLLPFLSSHYGLHFPLRINNLYAWTTPTEFPSNQNVFDHSRFNTNNLKVTGLVKTTENYPIFQERIFHNYSYLVNAWRRKIWKFCRKFDPNILKIKGGISPKVQRYTTVGHGKTWFTCLQKLRNNFFRRIRSSFTDAITNKY